MRHIDPLAGVVISMNIKGNRNYIISLFSSMRYHPVQKLEDDLRTLIP